MRTRIRRRFSSSQTSYRSRLRRVHTYEEMHQLNQELLAARAQLERQATYDGLTELLNHDAILKELESRLDAAASSPQEGAGPGLAALMLDIDHFKSVNDMHGHPVGDAVPQSGVRCVGFQLRRTDQIGRYGGRSSW